MKLVNINNIIYRIEQLIIDPVPIADCYEWIGAAMYHIGIPMPEKLKTVELTIENYKATAPCDMQQFIKFLNVTDSTGKELELNDDPSLPRYYQTFLMFSNQKFILNDGLNPFQSSVNHSFNPHLIGDDKDTWNTKLDYRLENNTFHFSYIKEGTIKMQYWGIMTDENELPLLPDEETYLEACMWYCAKQLSYQGYPFKNSEIDIKFTESKWNRKCLQARSEIRMPDIHMMQRMTNESLRLLPIHSHYYTGFKYLGVRQQNFRHGGYK